MKSANTVQKEIARLFQLGKKQYAPYKCSNTAQTFMNLYLHHKHNLKNPFLNDIIAEYKRFGRICARYTPWISIPIQGIWELNIYFNKAGKLLSHNADEIVEIFRDNLVEMMELNPGKKIALEFNSVLYVESIGENGHSEVILYDPAFNTIEYIDSNNLPKQCSRQDKEYFTWCEIRQETVRKIVTGLPSDPLFITNADIYGGYEWGIQSLEASSNLLTTDEKEGYCLIWSHLLGDLGMQFPDLSMKEIISAMIKKAGLKTVSVKYINDYMLFIIRGYVYDISYIYGVDFTSTESLREGCCRIAAKL